MSNIFFLSLEDPKKRLLGPNIWILKKLGLILPENSTQKILYIILHATAAVFVSTQYVELYKTRSNLDLVLTNMTVSMLSVVCIVKSVSYLLWQEKWKEIIEYITSADDSERNCSDPIREKILSKYTRYCRRVTYYYWILVFTTYAISALLPIMQNVCAYMKNPNHGPESFHHMFSSWMPFNKYASPGCWVTLVWHVIFGAYGAMTMSSYDSSIIVYMVFFGGKLDLLRERCRTMLGTSGIVSDDFDMRIRELHQIHVHLLKYSRLFNSLLSPVMFLYIILCSLMLCASAFQITMATNATEQLLLAEYLIFGVAQLFIFCWHSNGVLVKFNNVMSGPYESEWWTANLRQRKSVLLLAGQFRITKAFTAGPFTSLTLPTFITILKGAYSYYTLFRK